MPHTRWVTTDDRWPSLSYSTCTTRTVSGSWVPSVHVRIPNELFQATFLKMPRQWDSMHVSFSLRSATTSLDNGTITTFKNNKKTFSRTGYAMTQPQWINWANKLGATVHIKIKPDKNSVKFNSYEQSRWKQYNKRQTSTNNCYVHSTILKHSQHLDCSFRQPD